MRHTEARTMSQGSQPVFSDQILHPNIMRIKGLFAPLSPVSVAPGQNPDSWPWRVGFALDRGSQLRNMQT